MLGTPFFCDPPDDSPLPDAPDDLDDLADPAGWDGLDRLPSEPRELSSGSDRLPTESVSSSLPDKITPIHVPPIGLDFFFFLFPDDMV